MRKKGEKKDSQSKKAKPKQKKCPDCRGKGRIIKTDVQLGDGIVIPCKNCDGEGFVKK